MDSHYVKLGCALIMLLATGCGDDAGRVSVSGTITYRGEPVKTGSINFTPGPGNDGPSAGTAIKDGRFSISRAVGPTSGQYTVTITVGTHQRFSTTKNPRFQVQRDLVQGDNQLTIEWPP